VYSDVLMYDLIVCDRFSAVCLKMSAQKHLEQIAPQFRKEILNGGTFTKMVILVVFVMRLVVYAEGLGVQTPY